MCVKIPRKIWGGGGGVAFLSQQRYMQNSRAFTQKYLFYQISCMVKNSCPPTYPQDGICHSKDEDGIKTLVEMNQVLLV